MKIKIVRKTDQWNNEDFTDGPRVFTVSHVTEGREQSPYDIHFSDGGGKCWRPSNGMLELLIALWGDDSKVWAGRQVELFRDASVKIGRDVVGGIRVRSISHITKTMSPPITVSRGTKRPYMVKALGDAPSPVASDDITRAITAINAATDVGKLDAIEKHARSLGIHETPEIQGALIGKRGELEGLI